MAVSVGRQSGPIIEHERERRPYLSASHGVMIRPPQFNKAHCPQGGGRVARIRASHCDRIRAGARAPASDLQDATADEALNALTPAPEVQEPYG